jgi:multiple sugar transport system substrate-binding protein
MKKAFVIQAFVVLGLLLAAGMVQSGAADKTGTAGGKRFEGVTLKVGNMLGWPVLEPLWTRLEQFKQETGITVSLQSQPMAQFRDSQMQDALQHTGTFDVYLLPASHWEILSTYVVPVEDFMLKEGIDVAKFKARLNAPPEDITYKGKLTYMMANGMGVQSGYYRKDLFDDPKEQKAFKEKYGYDLGAPKTIEQMVQIAEFFTRDTNKDGQVDLWGLLQAGKGNHGYGMFQHQLKNSNLDILNNDHKCTWGREYPAERAQVLKIAQHNRDLIWKHKVTPPEVVGMQMAEISQLWFAGKAAMIVGWIHDIWGQVKTDAVKAKIGQSVSFVFPKWVAGAPSFGGGWCWAVNKDSKVADAGWEFIEFAIREDTQKYLSENNKAIFAPIFTDLAKWAADTLLIPPSFAQETKLVRMRFFLEEAQVTSVMQTLHEKLMANQITPEQFVDMSADQINKIVAKRKR